MKIINVESNNNLIKCPKCFLINIDDYYDNYYPYDSYEYEFNQPKVLIGFRLGDIIK